MTSTQRIRHLSSMMLPFRNASKEEQKSQGSVSGNGKRKAERTVRSTHFVRGEANPSHLYLGTKNNMHDFHVVARWAL